jgi:drug/metabolite transporter (DMT)-like permease
LTALLLAVFGAGLYGAADFLGGLASRRDQWLPVTTYVELIGLLPLAGVAWLLSHGTPTLVSLEWGAAAGLIGGIGIALLYRGLALGQMSVVAPITGVCATVIPVVAGIAFGEHPPVRAIVGIVVAVLAVLLVSQGSAHGGESGNSSSPVAGVAMALASGVTIGGFLVLIARANGNGLWPLLVSRIAAAGLLMVMALASGQRIIPQPIARTTATWGGIFDTSATVCYALAVHPGALGIIATLIALYPAGTLVLARVVLGERLRRRQSFGLVCAAGAVVLITSA